MAENRFGGLEPSTRRRFLGLVGATGVAATLPTSAGATLAATVDDALDLSVADPQTVFVVFEDDGDVDRLASLDLVDGFHAFEALAIGYARLTGPQIAEVASWAEVLYVSGERELEYLNGGAREATGAEAVHAGDLGVPYTGEGVHAVLIDSGLNGNHPDFAANLESNYEWVGDPLEVADESLWIDVGTNDTDDLGHGTHCGGTLGGDGEAADGEYAGMAPDVTLTSYSMNAGPTVSNVMALAAYDHMVERRRAGETTVVCCSNSWGAITHDDFDPRLPVNVASWYAFEAGILPIFAYGNSGDDGFNDYAKGAHTLGVAATDHEAAVTGFSSRGRRPEHDRVEYDRETALTELREFYGPEQREAPTGIHRPGIATVGESVMSTLTPTEPLWAAAGDTDEELPWYGRLSGTSMACPGAAGIAALVVEGYRDATGADPSPVELVNTLEATARDLRDDYAPWNVGAGFVDAEGAVERATAGDLAGFDDVTIAPGGE